MIIENVRLGKKQVLKIIQNGQVVWEYDNRFSLGSGVIETFSFDNVQFNALVSYIMQSSISNSKSVSSDQAKLSTIIMQPMKANTIESGSNTTESARLNTIVIYGMPGEVHSESVMDVTWQATPPEPLTISFMSGYTRDVHLMDIFAEKLYVLCTSIAGVDATMLLASAGDLTSDILIKHSADVDLLKPESSVLASSDDISTSITNVVWHARRTAPLKVRYMARYVGAANITDTYAGVLSAPIESLSNIETSAVGSIAGKLISEIIVPAPVDVEFSNPKSSILDVDMNLSTEYETDLEKPIAGRLIAEIDSGAVLDVDMTGSKSGVLLGDVMSQNHGDVELSNPETKRPIIEYDTSSECELKLNPSSAERLRVTTQSYSNGQLKLVKSSSKQAGAEAEAKAITNVEVKTLEPERININDVSESITDAKLKPNGVGKLKVVSSAETKQDSKLHKTIQADIQYAKNVLSKIKTTLDWLQANDHHRYIDAFVKVLSAKYSKLLLCNPLNVGECAAIANSYVNSTLSIVGKIILGEMNELSNSASNGAIELSRGVTLGEFDEIIKSNHYASAEIYRSNTLSDFSELLMTKHYGEVDIYRARSASDFSELFKTDHYGAVEVCNSINMTEAIFALKSAHEATFERVRPTDLTEFSELLTSSSLGSIDAPRTLRVVGSDKTYSSSTGNLSTSYPKDISEAQVTTRAIYYASLSFDGETPQIKWYYPVQTGSHLYIRSVWLFWNEAENGYIDIDRFYAPVQVGSDLYIRSAWSSYQDRDGILIDMDVFYPPVQSGSDLYVRSVDKFWTDGSNGNVDMDVFLEPVQEGNNLYIRQNIFGGE